MRYSKKLNNLIALIIYGIASIKLCTGQHPDNFKPGWIPYSTIDSTITELNGRGFFVLNEVGAKKAITQSFDLKNCNTIVRYQTSLIEYQKQSIDLSDQQIEALTNAIKAQQQTSKILKRRLVWQSVEKWAFRGLAIAAVGTYLICK
jgi:hypothetical protein